MAIADDDDFGAVEQTFTLPRSCHGSGSRWQRGSASARHGITRR
jgi:hypothetical protein